MRTHLRAASRSLYGSFVETATRTVRSFSASGRALFIFFSALLVVSSLSLIYLLNGALLVTVPADGGSLAEGIIGAPRFINPVLAISDADRDLSALVYSGLLKASPDGGYIPDLAQSYTVSDDGRVYTFVLRPDATFHDGKPVVADDVVFTIQKTQDAQLKSPERADWDSVVVAAPDEHTVTFTLKQAYAPFVQNLTLGILPKHLWQGVSDDEMPFSTLNTSPVGSGPFMVGSISHSSSGIPDSYTLEAFPHYALGKPYLTSITLRFYQNEDDLVGALKGGAVEAASGISPATLGGLKDFTAQRSPLDRIFGVFFNQNQSEVLRDKTVRQALDGAVDRQALVGQVLGGYGTPLTGPVPPALLPAGAAPSTPEPGESERIAQARATLEAAGWKVGPDGVYQKTTGSGKDAKTTELAFSLSTGNVPELRAAAEYLRRTWAAMGAGVEVHVYDQGDLSQNVIRPRRYDALLFGEVVGRELDLFAFWDSSQRNDPGLNIALYANPTTDKLLAQLRQVTDPATKGLLYQSFTSELAKDVPAVFLYTPDFVYIVPKDLQGLDTRFVETPSDRFITAYQWHREVDHVWPLFAGRR